MAERPSGISPENEVDDDEPTGPDDNVETTGRANVEPIRTVVRELTRPDGSTVTVEVPVYPPFEMKDLVVGAGAKAASNHKRTRTK